MAEKGAADAYVREHAAFLSDAPPVPEWVQDVRLKGLRRFTERGFPTRKDEAWRYTSVAPIARKPFRLASRANGVTQEELDRAAFRGFEGTQLVIVNGRYVPDLSSRQSLPDGSRVRSLANAIREIPQELKGRLGEIVSSEADSFASLNSAFLSDGAYLRIPKGAVVEQPIHLLYMSTPVNGPSVSHPRSLIVLEPEAEATIVETFVGRADAVYFTNSVTEVEVGEAAKLDHYKLQRESEKAFHVATLQVQMARSSAVSDTSVSLGGALVRSNVSAWFGGEGGDLQMYGIYLANGRQHVDNHTRIDHAMPHCTSLELYKGILDGDARAVFYGNVLVHKDAQKTNADQRNKNLLLSERALVDSIPGLQIHANDVKCKHGSSIGHLDEDAVFYLRSRGLDEATARSLLTYAFASEIMNGIRVLPLKAALGMWILSRLPSSDLVREAL